MANKLHRSISHHLPSPTTCYHRCPSPPPPPPATTPEVTDTLPLHLDFRRIYFSTFSLGWPQTHRSQPNKARIAPPPRRVMISGILTCTSCCTAHITNCSLDLAIEIFVKSCYTVINISIPGWIMPNSSPSYFLCVLHFFIMCAWACLCGVCVHSHTIEFPLEDRRGY